MLREIMDRARAVAEGAGRKTPEGLGPYVLAEDPHVALKHQVAEVMGELIRFWGFGRNLGRIWSWLYLTPQPMNAADLQEALQLSAGTVSTSLKELRHWRVVKVVADPGTRADHFTAETNILPAILKVFRERELDLIDRTIRTLEGARAEAFELREAGGSRALQGFLDHRLGRLLDLARMGHGLLSSMIALRSPDLEILRRALRLD